MQINVSFTYIMTYNVARRRRREETSSAASVKWDAKDDRRTDGDGGQSEEIVKNN